MSEFQTEGVSFESYRTDYFELKAREQDLKSAMYAIHPYPSEEDAQFFVVLFPDMETGEIEYEVLDQHLMQLRLLPQVPKQVILFIGELFQRVYLWSEGQGNYPHSHYQFPDSVLPETSDIGEERLSELDSRESAAMELIKQAGGVVKEPS